MHIKITSHEIRVGQLNILYQVVGQGEPVILIHGLAASSRWWARNIDALAEHYQLYLLDLPGFGRMRHLPQYYTLDEITSCIVLWMEAVGISQAHLIGHSMGGCISLWIAALYPERIRRLVLVSPAGVPYRRSLTGYLLPLLLTLRSFNLRFFLILLADTFRAGPRTIVLVAQDLLSQDIRRCLKDVSATTLLIWGEYDSLVPPAFGNIWSREMGEARLLLLKRAGHVPMFDQPEAFNAAVLAFFASWTAHASSPS